MIRSTTVALAGLCLLGPAAAQAAPPELATSNRLPDRRYVAAAERAQIEGFQDGRFYANGWHITGRDGRHLDAAAEAPRRCLVRH